MERAGQPAPAGAGHLENDMVAWMAGLGRRERHWAGNVCKQLDTGSNYTRRRARRNVSLSPGRMVSIAGDVRDRDGPCRGHAAAGLSAEKKVQLIQRQEKPPEYPGPAKGIS